MSLRPYVLKAYNINVSNIQVDMSNNPIGVYIIEIVGVDGSVRNQKMVKAL